MSNHNPDIAEYLETVGPDRRKRVRIMGFHVTMTYEGQGTTDVWFEWEPHTPSSRDFTSPRAERRFMSQYGKVRDKFMREMMALDHIKGALVVIEPPCD